VREVDGLRKLRLELERNELDRPKLRDPLLRGAE
jgi:hypothetical protein